MRDAKEFLGRSVFITVTSEDGKSNCMVLGLGFEGRAWRKPIFVALVKEERYTYELLQNATSFTISVPKAGEMREAVGYFGSKSGRNEDKMASDLVTFKKAEKVNGYLVDGCDFYIECNIVYVQPMKKEFFRDQEYAELAYPNQEPHVMFLGEIVE